MLIVCLNAAQRPDQPESWVTLSRLATILPVTRINGGRRITEVVEGFRQDGFLDASPAPNDRRVRILTATEKMLAVDREWLRCFTLRLPCFFPRTITAQRCDRSPPTSRRTGVPR
jgi:hypothetical protein